MLPYELYNAYYMSDKGVHPAGRLINFDGNLHVLEDYYNLLTPHVPEGFMDEYTSHCLNHPPANISIAKEQDQKEGRHLDLIPELATPTKMPESQDVQPLDISAALQVPEHSVFEYHRHGLLKPSKLESHSTGEMLLDGNSLTDPEKQLIMQNLMTGLATLAHSATLAKSLPETKGWWQPSKNSYGEVTGHHEILPAEYGDIKEIPMSNVYHLHGSVNPVDPRLVDSLASAVPESIPPVYSDGQGKEGAYVKAIETPLHPEFPKVFVSDGTHRVRAAVQAGRTSIPVAFSKDRPQGRYLELKKSDPFESLAYFDKLHRETGNEEALKHLNALRQSIAVDPLTGVGNRAAFNDHIKKNQPGTWVVSDMNDFRNINSEFGHQVGDQAIQAKFNAAKAAQQEVGQENMKIFRPMGDEGHYFFHKPEHAYQFVRAFQKHLDAVPAVGGTHKLSISTGMGPSVEHADQAMYGAKALKSQFKAANPTMQNQTPHFHSTHESMKAPALAPKPPIPLRPYPKKPLGTNP